MLALPMRHSFQTHILFYVSVSGDTLTFKPVQAKKKKINLFHITEKSKDQLRVLGRLNQKLNQKYKNSISAP